jgi:parvulin-like peptidyl-prolyl isomerase
VRTLSRTLAVLLSAVLLAACNGGVGADEAATVNGEPIPRDLLERIVNAQLEGPNAPEDAEQRQEATGEVQRNVLTTLIGIEIVSQLADEQGVEPSEEELEEVQAEQVELAGGEEQFDQFLETIGLDEDEYRELIVADLARRDALTAQYGEEVSDQQVEAAYEERRETEFLTRSTRHILVETEDEADDVVDQLDEGADFGDLAGEVSTDPGSGEQGGELGDQPRGSFVPEFDEAVWNAEIGDVVGPVESEFGFHVIEVLDETEVSYDEAEPQLRAELEGAAGQTPELVELFEGAYADADIEVGSGLGEWDPELGQVVEPGAVGEAEPAPEGEQPPADVPGEEELTDEQLEELEELQRQLEEEQGGVEDGAPDDAPAEEPDEEQ